MITIRKLWGWVCNCFSNPPRPGVNLDNDCYGPNATGAGQNPLNGLICTEPPQFTPPYTQAVDPPTCYTGASPCDPMPTLWRVAFPCRVPGSTCSGTGTGTGTGTGSGTGTGCDPITVLTHPTGPPSVIPPYQDCPSCWTASPFGISGGFGNISSACCEQLNGLRTFCYVPSSSVGNSLVWGSNCVNSNGTGTGTGTGHGCFPQPADANRRKWQLEYDKGLKKWSLFSFNVVQTPRYELADEDPCTGSTKVLSLVDPGGATSGCADAPPTITITRQTDCSACSDYNEPGCQVMLVRQCGIDGYATYSYTPVSADPKLSILCAPTRGHDVQTCCDVDCDYTFSGCCPIQGTPFIGSMDPWFDRRGDIKVWDLDLAADPITLTGTFIEGNIVYEVDSYGLQCGGITKLNQVSTTLPPSLARLYPLTACMVPDELLTCNVRVPHGTGTFHSGNFSPCACAGYTDFANGLQQFCDANDTCNPSIYGTITVGTCVVPVCATRQSIITGQDPLAKTKYPRIACGYINDGTNNTIVTQVIYPVGPANKWASDWYCTSYNPADPNPRNCAPCTATIGAFKGTTYANKSACATLPLFSGPVGGLGDCRCGPLPCCNGTDTTCKITFASGCVPTTGLPLNGRVITLNRTVGAGGVIFYQQLSFGFGGKFFDGLFLTCSGGVWTLSTTLTPPINNHCNLYATSTNVVCSPHMSGTFTNGSISWTGCPGSNPCPSINTFTAVVSI